ncbi:MAG: glycoside hydrolase family 43 protein [Duncaniella sp.]|nr:glycoside hydrolase family 43 protein [Duncaniella sp.]
MKLFTIFLSATMAAMGLQGAAEDTHDAVFSDFSYHVTAPDTTAGAGSPMIAGCYPDPSIVRVEDDYFLVNSSFAFFPGVPIWHSTDLKNWERLGYVLNRREQLDLPDGLRISGGIYAPDLSYNPRNGLFYMITTLVDNGGNFYVTCTDPLIGDWSDPVWLPEVGGIDPSILFDTDGRGYIVNNDAPEGEPLYEGHRAIHIHDFDWRHGKVEGKSKVIVDGGVNISDKPVWIEGPHLYHIGDKYFLMCAEGGTGPDHREVIFSSDSPKGPFEPCAINPILTQRDLSPARPDPVTCAGHADLVEDKDGNWWSVFLGVRPYNAAGHDIMGRETYIHPVKWTDGQPVITEPGEILSPKSQQERQSALWTADGLVKEAFFIRNPQPDFYTVDSAGTLRLKALLTGITDRKSPAAIGLWATENAFEITTTLKEFLPVSPDHIAGLVLFQDDNCNILLGKSLDTDGTPCVKLVARSKGAITHIASHRLRSHLSQLRLKIVADGKGEYRFFAAENAEEYAPVGTPVPASNLSTSTAGNFTGTMVGVYASAKK